MKIGQKYFPFFVAGLVILALYAIVVAWAYATGNWIPAQDSVISELGVCEQNGVYERTPTIPEHVIPIYACGKVDGSTNTVGAYYLYQDTDGSLIDSGAFTLSPGVFFIPLALPNALEKGSYRLEFSREKIVRARADFTVQ